MRERLTFRNFIAMFLPPFLYTILMEICGYVLMFAAVFALLPGGFYEFSAEQINFTATAVSAALAIPIFYRMLDKEELLHPTEYRYEKTKNWKLILAFLMGMLAASGLNRLMTLVRIDQWFTGYQETASILYSASVPIQLIVLGCIVPCAEEIIFRGVVYARMKRCFSVTAAAVISSLFFGIWHGNVSQGIYAGLLGLLLAYVRERYQTLAAPILFHMGANISSVLSGVLWVWDWSSENALLYPAFCVVELALCVVILWGMEELVHPVKRKKNREWHREEKESVDRNYG